MVELSVVEARVLGSLMEKEMTTPEYYPLSLNALVNACNQKSSREPVMALSESDVRGALFSLDELALVRTLADGRVSKFEHRVRDGLGKAPGSALRRDEFAVICLLLLRGPQTVAELRARAERLYSFDDTAAVQTTLERLAARDEPLTRLLQRQPGAREVRWTHLLSGDVVEQASVPPSGPPRAPAMAGSDGDEILQRLDLLEEAVQSVEERLRVIEEKLAALEGFEAP